MNIVRYSSGRAFLDAVEPFLLADEACHNLLLGIPARLIAQRSSTEKVYLAAAVDRGEVAGAAMMTPPWPIVLSMTGRRDTVRCFAEDVATIRPAPPAVNGPAGIAEEFAAVWQELTGETAEPTLRQGIHRLDSVQPVPAVAGCLRPAAAEDRPLLLKWIEAFVEETFPPESRPPGDAETVVDARLQTRGEGYVMWDDVEPRCLAGYGSATKTGIRIGPVYTPPEQRNRGYATACVAALSRRLLDQGRRFCMLYTDLANPISNRIYRRIGYEPVCDVAVLRFVR